MVARLGCGIVVDDECLCVYKKSYNLLIKSSANEGLVRKNSFVNKVRILKKLVRHVREIQ